jgi:TolA-binding protein
VLLPEQDFARLVAQNRIEQAWDSWTRHSDSPTYRPAASDVFLLAAGLLHRRETELAEKALRAYLRGYPRGADLDQVHLALGMVARSKGRLLAAREHYLAALDVSPPGSATAKRAQEALRALPEA